MSLSEEASASSCPIDLYADTLFCSRLTSPRSILEKFLAGGLQHGHALQR